MATATAYGTISTGFLDGRARSNAQFGPASTGILTNSTIGQISQYYSSPSFFSRLEAYFLFTVPSVINGKSITSAFLQFQARAPGAAVTPDSVKAIDVRADTRKIIPTPAAAADVFSPPVVATVKTFTIKNDPTSQPSPNPWTPKSIDVTSIISNLVATYTYNGTTDKMGFYVRRQPPPAQVFSFASIAMSEHPTEPAPQLVINYDDGRAPKTLAVNQGAQLAVSSDAQIVIN